MKLTGKLKERVSKAETKEQAKELIANAGMELTDEEMAHVSGGDGSALMQAMAIQDMILLPYHNGRLKITEQQMILIESITTVIPKQQLQLILKIHIKI